MTALSFPTSPSLNQTYTSGTLTWTWDGSKWTPTTNTTYSPIYVGDTPPASPLSGNLWWDNVGGDLYVYYAGTWVSAQNIVTPPAPPSTTPIGGLNTIAYNNAGTESGDANNTWNTSTATLTVNGSIVSNTVTSTAITSNTVTSNTVVAKYLSSNGSVGTVGQVLTSGGAGANTVWSAGSVGYRNRIINGDMKIDQRNGGASGTAGQYTVDRWYYGASQSSKGTWGRNLNAIAGPAGFPFYLGFQSSSSYSVLTGDYDQFFQVIEADAINDLQWGTVNAQPVTLSFWVYSSLGGATPFSGVIKNYAATRSYPFTYSIPVANVWTYITVTIPGDTTGNWVIMSGNGLGSLYVQFDLGCGATFRGTAGSWATGNLVGTTGSVSVVGTNAATWYVTGVQLEVGSVATPFERLPPQVSLALCQRYYSTNAGIYCISYALAAGNAFYTNIFFPVTMRAIPTITQPSLTSYSNASAGSNQSTTLNGFLANGVAAAGGLAYYLMTWTASAEL